MSLRSEHHKYPASLPVDLLTESEDEAEQVRLLACVSNRRDGRYQLPGWPGGGDVTAAMLFAATRMTKCLIVVRDNAMRRGGQGITGPSKRTTYLPAILAAFPGVAEATAIRLVEGLSVAQLEEVLRCLQARDAQVARGRRATDREDDGE